MIKTIVQVITTAILTVAIIFATGLVGDNQSGFGGTRYPSGLSADSTSPIAGEVRGTTLNITGATDLTGAVSVGNFTQGGACTATSSSGILTEAVLIANNCITGTATGAGQAAFTLTLPATSTMTTLIPNAGDCKTFIYNGQALAVGTTTTFAKGTGWDVVGIDTNADVIAGLNNASLTACRETDTDVTGFISEYVPAD